MLPVYFLPTLANLSHDLNPGKELREKYDSYITRKLTVKVHGRFGGTYFVIFLYKIIALRGSHPKDKNRQANHEVAYFTTFFPS
jgi:hypothetical protein